MNTEILFEKTLIGHFETFNYIIMQDALKPSFILTRIKYKLKVDDPVIDLHFLNNGLFAVTYRDVLFIDYNKKETKKLNTNENQVINYCSVLAKSQTGDLVVGRDDGIYFFNCEEQLSCLAFSDEKVSMCWFDGYLAVMSIESTKKIENKSRYMLNIYDIENKIISFSMFFKYQQNAMISVLSDHGSITLFSPNQHLYKIFELNTKSKLEMLFNKNLYQLAINVAIKKNFNEKLISEIYEQFADYLYNKSNFSQAMEYYVKTIGYLASSYVIQLYLKVQHFTELIIYLEGIHEKKLQTVDHTTLLLNSYIKFNDTVKIVELAKNQNIEFDLNVVIHMLRESNNWKIALELCQRYKDHKNLLKITLEDAHDYQIAIKHIQTLSCEEIDKYLKLFGKDILATNSSGMINLLYVFVNKSFTKSFKIDTSKYIQLFYNYPKLLLLFFEYILQIDSDENLVYKYLEIKLNLLESLENFTEKEGVSNELLNFIISNEDYNTNKVLMLLKNKKFKPGIIYLYKHMKRYLDLVKYLISEVDCDMIIHVCKEFGDEDCWSTALSFFCKSVQYDNYLKESTKYVIENEKLLIFDLMDILSKSKVAKVDIIKEYLIEYIKKESAKSGIIKHDIDSLDEKCKTVKEQIVKMDTDAIVFQASNCAICGDILDLPSTHFYCQHSFHLHCLEGYSEDINVCPMCKEERD
ncbi:Vacuolar protein sorting-associated protein 11, partial [Intoshia linei]